MNPSPEPAAGTPRVTLRGPGVGAGSGAAGCRALIDGLAAHGVRVVLEAQDPGGPALPGESPRTATPADAPADVHILWGDAAFVDVPVATSRRVVRLDRVPTVVTRALIDRLRPFDDVWVPHRVHAERLREEGLDPARTWVCPDPVIPASSPVAVADVHGIVVAAFIDAAGPGMGVLADAWAFAAADGPDATLLVIAPHVADMDVAAVERDIVAGLARGGHDPARVPDIVVVGEAFPDAVRSGLIAGADILVDPSLDGAPGRGAAEALVVGVPVVARGVEDDWGWPVPAPGVAALADTLRLAIADADGRARRASAARVMGQAHAAGVVAERILRRLSAHPQRRPRTGPVARPRVVLAGSVFGAHSLAAVNRGLARALLRQGAVDLALHNSEGAVIDPTADLAPSVRALAWACARHGDRAPDVVVRHGHPADLSPDVGGARVVAILPWEFGSAPVDWLEAVGSGVDEVWTPSTYTHAGWVEAGADPSRVAVVPNGIDPAAMHPAAPPMPLGDAAPGYRFLYVGGLAWRKGTDLLVAAYRAAFRRDDDVTLVVKDFGPGGPYPVDAADRLVAELAADPDAPRVLRLTGPLPEDDLPGLYTACDCLVHPYRAEAYGMTMAEAMACGRPVIAPSHGAARDFMDPGVALLVPARRVQMPGCEVAGHRLAVAPVVHEMEVADLAATMRWAYENRAAAAAVGTRAADHMHRRHTWDHAARIATQRLYGASPVAAAAPPPRVDAGRRVAR